MENAQEIIGDAVGVTVLALGMVGSEPACTKWVRVFILEESDISVSVRALLGVDHS